VGDCSAPLEAGALAAHQASFDDLYGDTLGKIETVTTRSLFWRIKQIFHLTADEKDREKVERVLRVYADSYPVARSV
jgi:hypothetical protein